MSSLPQSGLLANDAKDTDNHKSILNPLSPSADKHDTVPESKSIPDRTMSKTLPATRFASHQPSEGSGTTLLGAFCEGGVFDNASFVTLQDEFPWHEVDVNKSTQKIPSTIVPALLQGISHVSPSQCLLDEGWSPELAEISGDLGDVAQRHSVGQKGTRKACTGDVDLGGSVRSSSPGFHFDGLHNSIEDWVVHTRPILQDYADRQTSLPLGRRLEVSIDEPPQFILGAIQLLVNRDKKDCADRSRRLGPQLIENFVDIDLWAKEYFRSRHDSPVVDNDVSALLTIVINNFYEGHVQLIDRLVELALENMRVCGRRSLGVEDFAFGFDFKMSQDLPFYVETSSRIREPLPIPAVEMRPISDPVTTSFGRQVKPTERAQVAVEETRENVKERRNKKKDDCRVTDEVTADSPVTPVGQKKKFAPSCQSIEPFEDLQAEPDATSPPPPKTTTKQTKHRPVRSSNLNLPPLLPNVSSTAGIIPSQSNDTSESAPSASLSAIPKISSLSGSNLTLNSPLRFTFKIPPRGFSASAIVATNDFESNLIKINNPSSQINPLADASESPNRRRVGLHSRGARPRSLRNSCGPGRAQERGSTSLPPNEETPEVATDSTESLPTEHPVDTGNVEASDAAKPPMASQRRAYALRSTGTRGDGPSTPQTVHTSQFLLPSNDPCHPRRKKRKLGDCED